MVLRYTAILFSLLCLVIYSLYIQPWMFDDAYIFFRYAENLISGNGLVFNVGERVEGYTSFLWVILLSLSKLGGLNIILFSKITGILFAAGCILLTAFSHKFIDIVTPTIASIATLFLGTSGIFLPWGVSGIETTMFAFFVLLQVLYYISIRDSGSPRDFLFLGAIAGITTLTRPEGVLIFFVVILDRISLSRSKRKAIYLYALLSFMLLLIPHFIWRLIYYGYPLPNSFYAKVGFGLSQVLRGCRYMVKFGIPALLIILPLLDPASVRNLFRRRNVLNPAFMIVTLYTIYIILVGGDYMPGVRFFTPVMAIICILSSYVILTSLNRRLVPFLVSAIVLYNIYMLSFYYITPQIILEPVAMAGKEVGLWLKENAAPDAVIATNTAGSIPYYSGLKTIDMLGLNDTHIAHRKMPDMGTRYAGHEKADGRYVLCRKPDYIQFWSSLGWETPIFRSDMELYVLPEFHMQYKLKRIKLPSGKILMIFVRRQDADVEAVHQGKTAEGLSN